MGFPSFCLLMKIIQTHFDANQLDHQYLNQNSFIIFSKFQCQYITLKNALKHDESNYLDPSFALRARESKISRIPKQHFS